MKTEAQVMVEIAKDAKDGNARSMEFVNAALAEAKSNAKGKKAVSMLQGISEGTWNLLGPGGPVQTGTMTQGHKRFFKGLLPRLPAADRAKVQTILTHCKVVL